jgi:hypothetical protein
MTLEILTLLNSCSKDDFNNLQLFPSPPNFVSALSVVRFCVGKGTRVRGSSCKLRFTVNSTLSLQENVYIVIRLLWIQSAILVTEILEMLRGNFSSHVATGEVVSKFSTLTLYYCPMW